MTVYIISLPEQADDGRGWAGSEWDYSIIDVFVYLCSFSRAILVFS